MDWIDLWTADYVAMLFEGAIIADHAAIRSLQPHRPQFLAGSEVGPIPMMRREWLFASEEYKPRTTRQAQVGAFAIVAMLLLFGIFYVIGTQLRHAPHRLSRRGTLPVGRRRNARRAGLLQRRRCRLLGSIDPNLSPTTRTTPPPWRRPATSTSRPRTAFPDSGAALRLTLGHHRRPPRAKPPIALLPMPVRCRSTSSRAVYNNGDDRRFAQQGQGELERLLDSVMSRSSVHAEAAQHAADDAGQCQLADAHDESFAPAAFREVAGDHQPALPVSRRRAERGLPAFGDAQHVGGDRLEEGRRAAISSNRPPIRSNKSITALEVATDPQLKSNVLATTQSIAKRPRRWPRLPRPAHGHRRSTDASADPQYHRQSRRRDAEGELAARPAWRNQHRDRR